MANIRRIDCNYQQKGPCCVISSYSIIQNYFSGNALKIGNIMEQYCIHANIPQSTKLNRERAIHDAYHAYCIPIGIRGFEYIKMLHEDNNLNTRDISRIVGIIANENNPIQEEERTQLQISLRDNNRLAMVLYPFNPQTRDMHSIVIGWESDENYYFVKDPNDPRAYKNNDIFNQVSIYEYILFESLNGH